MLLFIGSLEQSIAGQQLRRQLRLQSFSYTKLTQIQCWHFDNRPNTSTYSTKPGKARDSGWMFEGLY